MAPSQIIFKVKLYAYLRVLQDVSPEYGRLSKNSVEQKMIRPKFKMLKLFYSILAVRAFEEISELKHLFIFFNLKIVYKFHDSGLTAVKEADWVK